MNVSHSPPNLLTPVGTSDLSSVVAVVPTMATSNIQDRVSSSRSDISQQLPPLVIGEHRNQTKSPSSGSHYDTIESKTTSSSNKKQLKTEYKSNFTPFDQYVYNEHTDSFVKSQHLKTPCNDGSKNSSNRQLLNSSNQDLTNQSSDKHNDPSPALNVEAFEPTYNDHASNGPWYKEVVRRNEKANEYRYKSEIGHQSPLLSKEILSDEDLVRRSPCGNDPSIEAQIRDHQQQVGANNNSTSSAVGTTKQAAIRFSPNDYKRDHLIAYMANNNNFNPPKEKINDMSSSHQSKMSARKGSSAGTHAASSRPLTRSGAQARARSQSSHRRPMTTATARNADSKSTMPSVGPSKSHQTTPTRRPMTARPAGATSTSTTGNRLNSHATPSSRTTTDVSSTLTTTTNRASSRPTTAAVTPTTTPSSISKKSTTTSTRPNQLATRRQPSANIKASPRTAALASSHRATTLASNSISNSVKQASGSSSRSATSTQRAPITSRSPLKKASPSTALSNRSVPATGPAARHATPSRVTSANKNLMTSSPSSTNTSPSTNSASTQVKSIKTPKALADAQEKAAAAALAVGAVATAGGAAAAVATSSILDQQQEINAPVKFDAGENNTATTLTDVGLFSGKITDTKTDEQKRDFVLFDESNLQQHEQFSIIQEPNFIFNTETGNILADELAQAEKAAAIRAAGSTSAVEAVYMNEVTTRQNDELFKSEEIEEQLDDGKFSSGNELVSKSNSDDSQPDMRVDLTEKPSDAFVDDVSSNELINGLKGGLISAEDIFDSSEHDVVSSLENNNNDNNFNDDSLMPAAVVNTNATTAEDTYTIGQGQNFDGEPYSIIATRYDNDAQQQMNDSSSSSDADSSSESLKSKEHSNEKIVLDANGDLLEQKQPHQIATINQEARSDENVVGKPVETNDHHQNEATSSEKADRSEGINNQDGDKVSSDRLLSSVSIDSIEKFGKNDETVDRKQESDIQEQYDIKKSKDLVGSSIYGNDNKHETNDHEKAPTEMNSSSSSADSNDGENDMDEASRIINQMQQHTIKESEENLSKAVSISPNFEGESKQTESRSTKLEAHSTLDKSIARSDTTNEQAQSGHERLDNAVTIHNENEDTIMEFGTNLTAATNDPEAGIVRNDFGATYNEDLILALGKEQKSDNDDNKAVDFDELMDRSNIFDQVINRQQVVDNDKVVNVETQVAERQAAKIDSGRPVLVESSSSSSSDNDELVNSTVDERANNNELLMNVADLVSVEATKKQDMARRADFAHKQRSSSLKNQSEVLLSVDQLDEHFNQQLLSCHESVDLKGQQSVVDGLTVSSGKSTNEQSRLIADDSALIDGGPSKTCQKEQQLQVGLATGQIGNDNNKAPDLIATSTTKTNSDEILKSSQDGIHEKLSSNSSSSQEDLMDRSADDHLKLSEALRQKGGQEILNKGETIANETIQSAFEKVAMFESSGNIYPSNDEQSESKSAIERKESQQLVTNDELQDNSFQSRSVDSDLKTRDNLANYGEDHDDQDDDLDSDDHFKLSNHLTNSDDELILEPRNSVVTHRLASLSASRYNEGAGLGMIAQEHEIETDTAHLADGSSAEIGERTNAENRIEVSTLKLNMMQTDLSQAASFIHPTKLTQEDDSDDEIIDLNHDVDPTDVAATMSPSSSVASELLRLNQGPLISMESITPPTSRTAILADEHLKIKTQVAEPALATTTTTTSLITTMSANNDDAKTAKHDDIAKAAASNVVELNVDKLLASSDAALRNSKDDRADEVE